MKNIISGYTQIGGLACHVGTNQGGEKKASPVDQILLCMLSLTWTASFTFSFNNPEACFLVNPGPLLKEFFFLEKKTTL